MLYACVHANLDDAWPHRGHRLPIGGQEALLHPAELVPSVAASVLGKCPEVLKRRTEPGHGFLRHRELYTYLYEAIKFSRRERSNWPFAHTCDTCTRGMTSFCHEGSRETKLAVASPDS